MMNMKEKEEMTYNEILDAEWAIDQSIIPRQRQYDECSKQYGNEELLTELAYKDLKQIRDAKKTFSKMVKLLRDNGLYTYSV
jgi:hypothetical protein